MVKFIVHGGFLGYRPLALECPATYRYAFCRHDFERCKTASSISGSKYGFS